MKKWKAANVSCAYFNDGSEKRALFVKTYGFKVSLRNTTGIWGLYNPNGRKSINCHPESRGGRTFVQGWPRDSWFVWLQEYCPFHIDPDGWIVRVRAWQVRDAHLGR